MRSAAPSLAAVARVLALMDEPPSVRQAPRENDLPGDFTFWFDGGAAKVDTGITRYTFTDGTVASTVVTPLVNAHLRFPSGREVTVSERGA